MKGLGPMNIRGHSGRKEKHKHLVWNKLIADKLPLYEDHKHDVLSVSSSFSQSFQWFAEYQH